MEPNKKRWKTILLWSVSILLAAFFFQAGGSKLFGAEMMIENFARWGLPDWFRPVTGFVEVAGGALLLLPRTRFYGATALAGTMVGAALTHLVSGVDLQNLPVVGVLLALTASVAWIQRPTFLRLQNGEKQAAA